MLGRDDRLDGTEPEVSPRPCNGSNLDRAPTASFNQGMTRGLVPSHPILGNCLIGKAFSEHRGVSSGELVHQRSTRGMHAHATEQQRSG